MINKLLVILTDKQHVDCRFAFALYKIFNQKILYAQTLATCANLGDFVLFDYYRDREWILKNSLI